MTLEGDILVFDNAADFVDNSGIFSNIPESAVGDYMKVDGGRRFGFRILDTESLTMIKLAFFS
jgi:hypothetical protein